MLHFAPGSEIATEAHRYRTCGDLGEARRDDDVGRADGS